MVYEFLLFLWACEFYFSSMSVMTSVVCCGILCVVLCCFVLFCQGKVSAICKLPANVLRLLPWTCQVWGYGCSQGTPRLMWRSTQHLAVRIAMFGRNCSRLRLRNCAKTAHLDTHKAIFTPRFVGISATYTSWMSCGLKDVSCLSASFVRNACFASHSEHARRNFDFPAFRF